MLRLNIALLLLLKLHFSVCVIIGWCYEIELSFAGDISSSLHPEKLNRYSHSLRWTFVFVFHLSGSTTICHMLQFRVFLCGCLCFCLYFYSFFLCVFFSFPLSFFSVFIIFLCFQWFFVVVAVFLCFFSCCRSYGSFETEEEMSRSDIYRYFFRTFLWLALAIFL